MKRPFLADDRIFSLLAKYGSPLYVYSEAILRERCREIRQLLPGRRFLPSYSAKANGNLELLKVIRSEGFEVDAMSPGEVALALRAGFSPESILFIGNNVSAEELRFAVERGALVSVDSLSQLELFGRCHPGAAVAVRFNPGVGAGHHAKVVTAGRGTKFGVQADLAGEVRERAARHGLRLVGINQHIGSLFLSEDPYLEAAAALLAIARKLPGLSFVDFGGGFGVPYRSGEARLDLRRLSEKLDLLIGAFEAGGMAGELTYKAEPGRYLVAESGVLLGTVHAVKESYGVKYVGTDLGFNVLARPAMYDAYHAIHLAPRGARPCETETATVVGNICETGDVLARNRELPRAQEGDAVAVLDAGAYGFSMASSYNGRPPPAEVLIEVDGADRLIRRRAPLEDLMKDFVD